MTNDTPTTDPVVGLICLGNNFRIAETQARGMHRRGGQVVDQPTV